MKKEVDKLNQQIKDNMKTLESKISLQEKSLDGKISKHDTQINEFKSNMKDLKIENQKTPKQGIHYRLLININIIFSIFNI